MESGSNLFNVVSNEDLRRSPHDGGVFMIYYCVIVQIIGYLDDKFEFLCCEVGYEGRFVAKGRRSSNVASVSFSAFARPVLSTKLKALPRGIGGFRLALRDQDACFVKLLSGLTL